MSVAGSRLVQRALCQLRSRAASGVAGEKTTVVTDASKLDQAVKGGVHPIPTAQVSDLGAGKLPERFAGLSDADKLLLDPTLDPLHKKKAAAKAAGAFGLFLLFMGGMNIFEAQLKAEIDQKAEQKNKPKFSVFVPREHQPQQNSESEPISQRANQSLITEPAHVTNSGETNRASAHEHHTPLPTAEELEHAKNDAAEQMLAVGRKLVEDAEAQAIDPETGEPRPKTVTPVFSNIGRDEAEEELSELEDALLQELELQYRLKRLRSQKRSKQGDSEKLQIKRDLTELTQRLASIKVQSTEE